jgi:hypothetical protein
MTGRVNVGRARLANQHVTRPAFDDPADVVQWLGAVQAQDYLGGLWAVGLRTTRATERVVEDAVARRAIVRTWPMRGTLHFVAAADVRWMTRLLTPRVISSARARHRQLGLDGAVFAKSARVAERLLAGGSALRRDALYREWNAAGVTTHESRGLYLLGYLAQTGLICFGPRDGKQQTFVLLDQWVPTTRDLERDVALGTLARRYFTSHGPATVYDFAWWSGLTVTDARSGLESVKSELASETRDGRTVWFAASRFPRPSRGGRVHLLPAWDEFTVAYRDRSDILDPRHAVRVNAGGGVLKPVVVVEGEVVGTWQRTLTKHGVRVKPALFKKIDEADRRGLAEAVARYGRFLGVKAE